MTNKSLFILFLITGLIIQFSCTQKIPSDLSKTAFIPKPVEIVSTGSYFNLSTSTTIVVANELEYLGSYLAEKIKAASGITLKVEVSNVQPSKGIFIGLSNQNTNAEAYILDISKKKISILAPTKAGCFNGIQTLLQTIPVKNEMEGALQIASGSITDFPEYAFRGAMLDVARHFFNVEEVKHFIDFLAAYKMNILHLHLSDDQGWRIEIKSWPKLTEIGGSKEVGGGAGGFYTQEEYTELVNYAATRNITIIPEIDMPGHTNAALASYAKLNCDEKARELYTGTDVGFSTLCTHKEITYQFVDDVVREISALTPGPWFHIGGDESHVTALNDYVYFVNRVQEIVIKHGKKIIGWDEIANAKLVENATVQFWADIENTTMGLEKGAKVIMSPASKAYLDMQYDSTTHLGLHWAGYIEVDDAYNWNPETMVPNLKKENILGIEAPLWSETVTNIDEVEYMVFPRLPGYAEIGWTATNQRNWDEYKTRLAKHGVRFQYWEIDFYPSERVHWEH
jgi:hexosaminidase